MIILITGANGLLGQKLVQLYEQRVAVTLIATGKGENRNLAGSYVYEQMDITSDQEVLNILKKHRPNIVIHTAAMTHVDQCELNHEASQTLNVTAVDYITKACKKYDCFLIHLSSDFIFDGTAGPYKEESIPNPLSKYGSSKLEAEQLIISSGIKYAIVRTVLVYGIVHDMSRSNIILWVKKSLEEKKIIQVVNDQWRTPTLAEDLAEGCALIANKKAEGIFNISGKNLLTPYEIAVETAKFFNLDTHLIQKVDSSIFTQPAKRPPKTGFILDKAKKELGYKPKSFKEGLTILKNQLNYV